MTEVMNSEENVVEPPASAEPEAAKPAPVNRAIDFQGRKIYTVSRDATIAEKGKSNYSHAYHENSFWVDTPIYLEAIGFLGPFWQKDEGKKYEVTLQIFKSLYGRVERHAELVFNAASDGQSVNAKAKQMFHVDTGKKFLCANVWYHIRFILKGPDTAILDVEDSASVSKEVAVDPIGLGSRDTVKFHLAMGSRQMPEIKFSVVPKEEYESLCLRGETGTDEKCCCSVA